MPAPIRLTPKTFTCPRISPPTIDGKLDDPAWQHASCYTDLARLDGKRGYSNTTLRLGRDERFLYIAVRCDEVNTDALAHRSHPYSSTLAHRDHLELNFDTPHDHVSIQQLVFGPFDQFEQRAGTSTLSHRAGPDARWVHWNIQDATPSHCHCAFATRIEAGECWTLEAAIPFEKLAHAVPQRGTVWGFNIARYTSWPVFQGRGAGGGWLAPTSVPCERTALAAEHSYAHRLPVAFADLVFDDDTPQLTEFDVGVPHIGENRSTLRFRAPDTNTDMTVTSRVRALTTGELIDAERYTPVQRHGDGDAAAEITWCASHYDNRSRLELQVTRNDDGSTAWRGDFELSPEPPGGKQAGALPLGYLYRNEHASVPAAPDPADRDFVRKKAEFIAAQQPRFERVTTAHGAPSDFTLRSADGHTQFNLMEEGVTAQMARYIHSLYDNDADRLLGATFFVHQPALMRANPAYDIQAIARLDPLSQLRYGAGYCGHVAGVLAHLLNHMPAGDTGATNRAHRMGIGGHAVVFAEYRGDYAVLDPQNCWVFYKMDNSELATLSDIRHEPAIIRRSFVQYLPTLLTFDADFLAVSDPHAPTEDMIRYPTAAPVC